MLPHLRRKFFSSISRPGFYTLQAGFVPRFRKGCWGNGRCKNTPTRTPRAVQSELYRDNPVTHIELCMCMCVSLLHRRYPSKRKSERKENRLGVRLIVLAGLTPPILLYLCSWLVFEGKRETSLSLMPAAMLSVLFPAAVVKRLPASKIRACSRESRNRFPPGEHDPFTRGGRT